MAREVGIYHTRDFTAKTGMRLAERFVIIPGFQ